MTDVRESERSGLDTGEASDGRNNAAMDMAMDMTMAVTSLARETPRTTIFQPMQRNGNGTWRMRSQAPVAPSNWKSRMEMTI
jgi:hypothetical protein